MNLYQKIGDDLRKEIASGQLKPGDKILSISEMKEKYKVSQITALRVYRELSADQLIVCRHGQGYFVCDNTPKPKTIFGRFACFTRTMRPTQNDDNYFNEINIGIQIEAGNRRIDLLLPHNAMLLDAYLPSQEMLADLKKTMLACSDFIDGYLLDERISDEIIREVIEITKKPAVVINRHTDLPINMVYPDNRNGVLTIYEMGRRMGYTQFIFCAKGDRQSYADYNSFARDAEFRKLIVDENHELLENCLVVPREIYLKKIEEAYLRHHKRGRVLLICTTDILAADLVAHFFPDGKSRNDLGIAGIDGLPIRTLRRPTISSMKIDTLSIGKKAVEVLQRSINGIETYTPSVITVPPVFEPGESMN